MNAPPARTTCPCLRAVLLAIALLAPVFSAGAQPPAPLAATDRLGFDGVGRVRIGMGFFELLAAVGRPLTVEAYSDECAYAKPAELEGLAFMLMREKVARIDVGKPAFRTISGARVGDSEASVTRLYGRRAEVSGHKYDENGHNVTVSSVDGKSAVVFETDGKAVTSFRVGRAPEVFLVEGCL